MVEAADTLYMGEKMREFQNKFYNGCSLPPFLFFPLELELKWESTLSTGDTMRALITAALCTGKPQPSVLVLMAPMVTTLAYRMFLS